MCRCCTGEEANPKVSRGYKLPRLVGVQTSDIDTSRNVDALSHVSNILQKRTWKQRQTRSSEHQKEMPWKREQTWVLRHDEEINSGKREGQRKKKVGSKELKPSVDAGFHQKYYPWSLVFTPRDIASDQGKKKVSYPSIIIKLTWTKVHR